MKPPKINVPSPQRLKVTAVKHHELRQHVDNQWLDANNEIFGKFNDVNATYLIIEHNGVFLRVEPVPGIHVKHMYEQAYLLGYWDGHGECLSKPHRDPNPPPPASSDSPTLPPPDELLELDDEWCAVCGAAIFMSPSGKVCSNGHGEGPTTESPPMERIKA